MATWEGLSGISDCGRSGGQGGGEGKVEEEWDGIQPPMRCDIVLSLWAGANYACICGRDGVISPFHHFMGNTMTDHSR